MNRKSMSAFLLLFPLFHAGCATERAISASTDLARAIGVAILEKSHFTDTAASANANINNPHYRVLAALIQGVYLDIGLDGVQVQGALQAQGSGPDVPLSPETLRMIRERGLGPDAVERLIEAALEAAPSKGP